MMERADRIAKRFAGLVDSTGRYRGLTPREIGDEIDRAVKASSNK